MHALCISIHGEKQTRRLTTSLFSVNSPSLRASGAIHHSWWIWVSPPSSRTLDWCKRNFSLLRLTSPTTTRCWWSTLCKGREKKTNRRSSELDSCTMSAKISIEYHWNSRKWHYVSVERVSPSGEEIELAPWGRNWALESNLPTEYSTASTQLSNSSGHTIHFIKLMLTVNVTASGWRWVVSGWREKPVGEGRINIRVIGLPSVT